MVEITSKACKEYEGVHITNLGLNKYLLSFAEQAHAREVYLKEPWYVMNHLLCLQFWIPKASTVELDFTTNPFWIQVHNLPLEFLNTQNVTTLLKKVGRVVEVEGPMYEGKQLRNFISARVVLVVTKPLPSGCWIPRVDLPKI